MKTKTNKWKIKEEKRIQELLDNFKKVMEGIRLEDYSVDNSLELKSQQNVKIESK